MEQLTDLPNIGPTLAKKLKQIGVIEVQDLVDLGSENAILKFTALKKSGVCLNMLYALEGAIQGIRWHALNKERKQD
jgi:DNA transformation protein